MGSTKGFKKFVKSKTFTLLLLFIGMILLFTILSGGKFLSVKNLTSILNGMVIVTFLAIGEAFLLILGNLDLSVGYLGTFSAFICCIAATNMGAPWWVALLAGIVVGGLGGFINAIMVCKLNFQAFIATLAMSQVCQGLTYVVSSGKAVDLRAKPLTVFGTKMIAGVVPLCVIVAMLFLIVYGVLLAKTNFGRSVYLCGGNPQAARLCGLNPKKLIYGMFINCGCLSAVAGIMYAARQKSIMVGGIAGNQFTGVTAAILGGISFGGGAGNMFGCFLGLCLLNGFDVGMTVLGVTSYVKTIFSGLLLIAALLFDNLSQANHNKRQLAATKKSH